MDNEEPKLLYGQCPYGSIHMKLEDFIAGCKTEIFTDYNGFGYYTTAYETISNKRICPSNVVRYDIDWCFSHVIWIDS